MIDYIIFFKCHDHANENLIFDVLIVHYQCYYMYL